MNAEEVMRRAVGAFGEGDLRPLFEALDDDILWTSGSGPGGPFRFSGEYRGRSGVEQALSGVFGGYRFQRLDEKEIVSSRDIVWGQFNAVVVYAPYLMTWVSPREISFGLGVRWRMKNGKIIEHTGFFDTASFFAQHGCELPELPS